MAEGNEAIPGRMLGGEKKGMCDEKRLEGSAETRLPWALSQGLGAWISSSGQWKAGGAL